MDPHQRGRSPSAGHGQTIRHSPSPSPHAPFHNNISGPGLDQSLSPNDPYSNSLNPQVTTAGQTYDTSSQFLTTSQPQQFHNQPAAADPNFLQQGQPVAQQSASPHFGPQGTHLGSDQLDGANNGANPDFQSLFPNNNVDQGQAIDPLFLSNTVDPNLLDPQPQNQSVDPSDLMNQMATTQAHSPTPPHLLQSNMQHQQSPSPHASPNIPQGAFPTPSHSRHTSLDPSHAYGHQGGEWNNMSAFRGHRRTPSETYSEVSSAQASPYLGNHDSFDHDNNPSPLLNAQQDPALFADVMSFGQFNLNDNNSHISPGHSPHISPRLIPQQQMLPQFSPNNFGLNTGMNNQFPEQQMQPMYQGHEPFPTINQTGPDFQGQADTMSPPEINIDFAPPSRQASFEPVKQEHSADALSPPDRSRSRNRIRAKSDPFSSASSRASTPASEAQRSLSPSAAKTSRSPSPSSKSSRRSSTSSIPHRDYILDLADPSRPANQGGDGSGPKRTQKHPATFQCSLCPKRFTRAYNLRSHLRTHTDERPFVCSMCGKAFARQHDRKRHEGLHSGEKRFVCRGVLKDKNNWGCGRRFARADALGRHFRSEAGRVCIRPLLEEEAAEKGGWDAQNQQQPMDNGMYAQPMQQNFGGMMHAPQPGFQGFPQNQGPMDPTNAGMQAPQQYGLPAALIAQYPALAGIQWDQLPAGPPEEVEGDISGRSSFDASSGGELFEEDDDQSYPAAPAVYGQSWG